MFTKNVKFLASKRFSLLCEDPKKFPNAKFNRINFLRFSDFSLSSVVEFNEDLGKGKIKVKELKPLGDGVPLLKFVETNLTQKTNENTSLYRRSLVNRKIPLDDLPT
jgi:hypothetical protein